MVCHEIRNGEIIFMPEPSYDWQWEAGQYSANVRIIKDHQIFSASSPAGEHDRVQSELMMLFRKAT